MENPYFLMDDLGVSTTILPKHVCRCLTLTAKKNQNKSIREVTRCTCVDFLLGDNILHTWVLLCFTLRLVSSSQMDSQLLTKQDKLEYTLQTMHDHPRILTKIGLSPSVIFPSKLSTKSISPQTKQHIFKLTFNMLQKTQLNPIHQYKNSSTILLMVEKSC